MDSQVIEDQEDLAIRRLDQAFEKANQPLAGILATGVQSARA